MPGKVGPDELAEHVFERSGAHDDRVRQGPGFGEDAAAIDVPAGTLVVSSDPISLAASQAGRLGVAVATNDVAASGADPAWLTAVCLLPTDAPETLATVTGDLDDAARELGVSIVGGHTEYVDALTRPTLSLTAMGFADPFVPTGGATIGNRVVIAGPAGLEGTAILASDFADSLAVPPATIEAATAFFEEISVVPAARLLRDRATAMHDPTEGGVLAGLVELAGASGVELTIEREAIPVRAETETLCAAADVDPLRIFGSGALLATVPDEDADDAVAALDEAGIQAASIGSVTGDDRSGRLTLDDEEITGPIADDLYPLWAEADERTES
ncbi:AIR synthase-like protein domain-containing protein [Halovivax asiaticus JCM 14624]|uniref:AIR synthase-like protein domain-containing protein n=1 Tax=Halovivax asiaticus JCM 14624 TaxID=1227490 RepID=M0BCC3_9EURY|nr:AIR synthase family protein [Halovivax asiaticus]ELZ08546.1 AIR synthase-like protein domain-containing protein [Halovivax asiaticus JCM 14624]